MMKYPWNLTPEEWTEVLQTKDNPERIASDLRAGRFLPWTEVLRGLTGDCEKVLDLGSGRGENSAALALQKKRTTLLDWSPENIDFSRRLYKFLGLNGEFYQADMTQPLPFKKKTFDSVFSCGVFEYFSDEQIGKILRETFRVARKKVIIMVPNAWSLPYRFGKWYMERSRCWNWGGERPFYSLRPYLDSLGGLKVEEFTVAAKHSLDFLAMPGGVRLRRFLIRRLKLADHSAPSRFKQGYLLITVAEKSKRLNPINPDRGRKEKKWKVKR